MVTHLSSMKTSVITGLEMFRKSLDEAYAGDNVGALLRGIDTLIMAQTGMPVHVADNPLDCVADGTGIYLESDVLGVVGKRL